MGSYGKKTRNPGWQSGNHWVICEVCGFAIRASSAKLTWDDRIVCPEDFEVRHPQDFVRGRSDNQSAQGLVSPEVVDEFIGGICTTRSSVAGVAIAGCSIAGMSSSYTPIPVGTFINSL
jgi:hypothetical protein